MKKIDEAVKRFGAPDYGRTAKRLRDFEADLVGDFDPLSMQFRDVPGKGGYASDFKLQPGEIPVVLRAARRVLLDTPEGEMDDPVKMQRVIVHQRAEIEALQQLLNEKDYEIDMLRNIKPVSTRDLWFTAGLVGLVMLGAYLGFM